MLLFEDVFLSFVVAQRLVKQRVEAGVAVASSYCAVRIDSLPAPDIERGQRGGQRRAGGERRRGDAIEMRCG